MAINKPVMPAASDMLTGDGKLSSAGTHFLDDLSRSMEAAIKKIEGAVEAWSWFIETPDDKDYKVIVNAPYAAAVNSITTVCTAGTCTLTGKINSTALGGTANSVSTSEQTQAHTSANEVAAGDDFVLTISSNSGCENLSVTVKITRAL